VLLAGTASAQSPCPGEPDGWRLRACLRAAHAPAAILPAPEAFETLVETVDVRTRLDSTLVTDSTFVAADSSWHVTSRWEVESVRYVLALDGSTTIPPNAEAARAAGWTAHPAEPDAQAPTLHTVGTPLAPDALPPPVNGHLDLLAAWATTGSVVSDSARGDLARGALYVRTVYPAHVEAAGTWPASGAALSPTLPTLLAWHEADPPDDAERERHDRASAAQGNVNPFVLDPSLAARAFPPRPPGDAPRPPGALWINEVHATNDGPDTGEGVEVAGPSGSDLLGHRLVFYGGHGEPYDPLDVAVPTASVLAGALPSEGALGTAWLPARGLWNRCNGVALVDPDGRVSHLLSYGGCQFNAVAGPVVDLAALDGAASPSHPDSLVWTEPTRGPGWRPVHEWTRMPAGYSLQLTGAGSRLADFAWGLHLATPGRLGDYQAAGDARSTLSIPPGLSPPLSDDGPNTDQEHHDAPGWHSGTTPPARPSLSVPSPNPVRRGDPVRLALHAGPEAAGPVRVEVLDALGRGVLTLAVPPDGAPLSLDTARFAAGAYVVRAVGLPGVAPRRFAVVQ
jgi:hypothetical protein